MKNKIPAPSPAADVSLEPQADATKLVSLLALATGAMAIPQTGSADIIYTDLNASPVLVGYSGGAEFIFNLPGTVHFGLTRQERVITTTIGSLTFNYRTVVAGDLGTVAQAPGKIQGNVNLFAVPLAFGAAWDQGLGLFYNVAVGTGGEAGHTPVNGYDNQYLAWQFSDSTQGGALRYGWMEISLSAVNYPTGPNVTLYGYAYDNTGVKPTMGVVPEPTPMGLLVLGALTLGSRGLRAWRQQRAAALKA